MWAFFENSWLALLLTMVGAYLLGSINFAIIITKIFTHEDIRNYGSGNAGATNVLRAEGAWPAALTTVGDLGKSIASVLLGGWLLLNVNLVPSSVGAGSYFSPENTQLLGRYLAGLFCIIGHLFPVFYQFRGGKGVLATLGMFFILDWRVALLCLSLFLLIVAISRLVSLGSVVGVSYLPVLTLVLRLWVDKMSTNAVIFCTAMAALIAGIVIAKHGANLRRIAEGTERRIGEKKEEDKGHG